MPRHEPSCRAAQNLQDMGQHISKGFRLRPGQTEIHQRGHHSNQRSMQHKSGTNPSPHPPASRKHATSDATGAV